MYSGSDFNQPEVLHLKFALFVTRQAFMERLGLWGDGTAFKSFDSFLTSITKRGLGKIL